MGIENISVETNQFSREVEKAQWPDFYEAKKETKNTKEQLSKYFLNPIAALAVMPVAIFSKLKEKYV